MPTDEAAFIRGYVAAVAEFTRFNGCTPADALRSANISRDLAAGADVNEIDLETLDEGDCWPAEGRR